MLAIILKRILIGIPTLIGATILLFVVLRVLPGDPVSVISGGAPLTPKARANLEHQFGLDGSLVHQYRLFVTHAAVLNFGESYSYRRPVSSLISAQLGATVELAVAAAVVAAVAGIVLGSIAAIHRGSWIDTLVRVLSLLNTSMPSFWVGILLIQAFAFALPIFPATGSGGIERLVLPAVTLGLAAVGTVARLVRSSVIEVLGENFVTTLHAKGIRRSTVVFKHVLRNAVIPTITIVGFQIGALLAGAVIVESVFSRQGIGQMLVQAIQSQDYPLVQGIALVIAVAYIVINIVVDISYSLVDPRIKTSLAKA